MLKITKKKKRITENSLKKSEKKKKLEEVAL